MKVPVTASNLADWIRKAATVINNAAQRDSSVSYTAPTISNPPTQAEVQAIADALEVVAGRFR